MLFTDPTSFASSIVEKPMRNSVSTSRDTNGTKQDPS
ncbi:hypothetical protein BH10PSE12_BH10PSE12_00620 [soil metagenome]